VEVLPSGKGNRAFWSDHGKAFVVTCSGDWEKKERNSGARRFLKTRRRNINRKFILKILVNDPIQIAESSTIVLMFEKAIF
jgi:hypothetical protein